MNMSPVEMAKKRAEQQSSSSNASFLSLKEGESVILRFLTGMVPYYIVNHSCGIALADIKKEKFDEAAVAGTVVTCPGCGAPLTDADIVAARPEVLGAELHTYFPTAEDGGHTTFTCLGSEANAMYGFVPADEGGNPLYRCPACSAKANMDKNGNPKRPSFRLYGVAVQRDGVMETEIVNGVPKPVMRGLRDITVEDGGMVKPKLLIVNMGWNNFWSKLAMMDQTYQNSICMYDWRVTRIGSGMQTTYDIAKVTDDPMPVDYRQYEQFMPDVKGMISSMGQPSFYVKKGYAVAGYVPEQPQAANTAASAAQQMMAQAVPQYQQQYQQPMQQYGYQPMPQQMPQQVQSEQGHEWSVVQGQFN